MLRSLLERFPTHNVAYLEGLDDHGLTEELEAAHALYGAHMQHNGWKHDGKRATREQMIKSILMARERFRRARGRVMSKFHDPPDPTEPGEPEPGEPQPGEPEPGE